LPIHHRRAKQKKNEEVNLRNNNSLKYKKKKRRSIRKIKAHINISCLYAVYSLSDDGTVVVFDFFD
jgi:hypothetical protein